MVAFYEELPLFYFGIYIGKSLRTVFFVAPDKAVFAKNGNRVGVENELRVAALVVGLFRGDFFEF